MTVTRVIRPLSGTSKAHLVEADDGHYYVVKILRSAKHVTSAVSEWLVAELLRTFEIPTPSTTSIVVPAHLPFLSNELSDVAPLDWPHFASQVPVDPAKTSIFDLLPRKLFPSLANVDDFWRIAVIDVLTQKVDFRQALFFRQSDTRVLQASFIDHKCRLLDLSSSSGLDFESDFIKRLSNACPIQPMIKVGSAAAFDDFCKKLGSGCWKTFLERCHPIPEAWREHVSDSMLHDSLSRLWERFRHLCMQRAHFEAVYDRNFG